MISSFISLHDVKPSGAGEHTFCSKCVPELYNESKLKPCPSGEYSKYTSSIFSQLKEDRYSSLYRLNEVFSLLI